MSRIGKKPVAMPSGVSANVEGQTLTVKGPKGTLSMPVMDDLVSYTIEEGQISVKPVNASQRSRASTSESTPRGVETITVPRPLRMRGSSCAPE